MLNLLDANKEVFGWQNKLIVWCATAQADQAPIFCAARAPIQAR
jgi:hypothetical protein